MVKNIFPKNSKTLTEIKETPKEMLLETCNEEDPSKTEVTEAGTETEEGVQEMAWWIDKTIEEDIEFLMIFMLKLFIQELIPN